MNQGKTIGNGAGADVSYFFGSLLQDLHEWAGRISRVFESREGAPGPQELDAQIHPLVDEFLDRKALPLVGAGFVAAKDALAGTPWHMAWWQGSTKERLLMLTVESAGETYSRREWFTVPLETGEGHITGSYVDFLCTDEYTLTLTVPVSAHGTIVGVAGADVLVETIELLLMDKLLDVDERATLLNGSGRVIVSADPQLARDAAGPRVAGFPCRRTSRCRPRSWFRKGRCRPLRETAAGHRGARLNRAMRHPKA